MRQEEAPVAVQHFPVTVGVGNDLAQKGVDPDVSRQFVPKCLSAFLIVDCLETIHGRLQMPLHVGMVGSTLALGRLVEHLREGFDLAPVVDLLLIEFVLECFET